MPVMGPNQDYAYAQGEEAFKEMMLLLKEKYHAERPSELLPFGKKYAAEWDALEAKLREAVKEMIWVDHASSF